MLTKTVRFQAVFILLTFFIVWLPACKTYNPTPLEEVPFLQRSQMQTVGGLTVLALPRLKNPVKLSLETRTGRTGVVQ